MGITLCTPCFTRESAIAFADLLTCLNFLTPIRLLAPWKILGNSMLIPQSFLTWSLHNKLTLWLVGHATLMRFICKSHPLVARIPWGLLALFFQDFGKAPSRYLNPFSIQITATSFQLGCPIFWIQPCQHLKIYGQLHFWNLPAVHLWFPHQTTYIADFHFLPLLE